ncbi:MAG TPA: cellulase family glycosylhydrolase, partial [Candidatus Acidoferrum sp.]|nr:cellulase family glycosylhydrolase [Candidatus Acidoferrum sp.]
PAPDEDHSPAFWKSVAATFKSDQGVIYDLFNEPFFYWIAPGGPNEWSCLMNGCTLTQYETGGNPFTVTANWKSAGMNELISDVRGTGAQNLIMVAGVNWARDLSGWLANRPQGSNIAAAWHSYPSANPSLITECAALSCWNSTVAPIASQFPIVVGETGDSAAGPETYLPAFLPWATAHGLSVIAWTWNAWTNPDDVLVSNMQNGSPTAGEGVTYRAWLAAQPVPGAAPVSSTFSAPPTAAPQPVRSTAPPAAAPSKPPAAKTGGSAPAPVHTQPAAPIKNPIHSDQPGSVMEPVASGSAQLQAAAAVDRIGLEAIYIGFALIGLAAAMWGVTSFGPLLIHVLGQLSRPPRPA